MHKGCTFFFSCVSGVDGKNSSRGNRDGLKYCLLTLPEQKWLGRSKGQLFVFTKYFFIQDQRTFMYSMEMYNISLLGFLFRILFAGALDVVLISCL